MDEYVLILKKVVRDFNKARDIIIEEDKELFRMLGEDD